MNNSMYASDISQAVGFTGLRSYVTDIESVLDRCRSGVNRRVIDTDVLDQTLVGELSAYDEQVSVSHPLHTDQDYLSRSNTGEYVYIDDPEPAVPFTSRKPKSAVLPALLSISAIVVTGVLAVVMMQKMDKNNVPVASSLIQLIEEAPPTGRGLVLKPSQIRYCIAQGIRLGGASEKKESLSTTSRQNLTAMLADYNSRCAEYRFQAGAFDEARIHVESLRADLQLEGVAMLASLEQSSSQNSLLQESEVPATGAVLKNDQQQLKTAVDELPLLQESQDNIAAEKTWDFSEKSNNVIKNIQWRLYKLNYYSGPINGVDSAATQSALRGFFSVHNEAEDVSGEQAVFRAIDKIYEQRH